VAAVFRTAFELYRRRAGPHLLVAAMFTVPSVFLGLLEQRAASGTADDVPSAGSPAAPGPATTSTPAAPAPPTALAAPAATSAGIGPAPPGTAAAPEIGLESLSVRDIAIRMVWLLIRGLFTAMLVAAVVREAALAVTGRPPAPLASAGYGFAHVLGLGFVGVLAASWALLLLFVAMPLFFLLSVLQRVLPAGAVAGLTLLVGLPVAVLFLTLVALAIPTFVVEGRRGGAALLRVWVLLRGELRHVAATAAVVLAVGFAVGALALAMASATGSVVLPAMAAELLATPFEALVAFFLYLELRSTKERLDVALLEAEVVRNAP
jgi:hypothetical protein